MNTRLAPADTTTASRPPMTPARKAALIAGIAYIATFVFSIPVKFGLWKDAIDKPDFILGVGSDSGIRLGALFEVLTGLGGVASAVALFAVAKRYSIRSALGFVATRVMEAVIIFVGVLAMLTMYTLRNNPVGGDESMSTMGGALLAIHDWTFLLGPGLMAAVNALLIGSVMYRSRLIPRWIPTLGLIGAPILIVSNIAVLYGAWEQLDPIAGLLTLPIGIWEFSFGVYMTVKGFRTVPEAAETTFGANVDAVPALAA
jgi:hypothetical protein